MRALLHPLDSRPTPLGKREQLIAAASARREHLAEDEGILEGDARALGHVGEVACAASPMSTIRAVALGSTVTSSIGAKWTASAFTSRSRIAPTGVAKSENSERKVAMSLSALSMRSHVRSA